MARPIRAKLRSMMRKVAAAAKGCFVKPAVYLTPRGHAISQAAASRRMIQAIVEGG